MMRAGGKATDRAKSGCDRQADTVPCCPTFSSSSIYELLPAVSGHVKLWPISLHLLEGWPGKPTTLLCFVSRSHVCRHTTISVYLIVECRPRMHFRFLCTVPVLMHFYKKGGGGGRFFNILVAAVITPDNNCQQALRHERASISPLPVLRHSSASYNRVSYYFSQHASTGKEIICSGM